MSVKSIIRNWLYEDNTKEARCVPIENLEFRGRGANTSFKVHAAVNGAVLESNRYDEITDNMIQTLYFISRDGDFATEIGSIISMEMLKY